MAAQSPHTVRTARRGACGRLRAAVPLLPGTMHLRAADNHVRVAACPKGRVASHNHGLEYGGYARP